MLSSSALTSLSFSGTCYLYLIRIVLRKKNRRILIFNIAQVVLPKEDTVNIYLKKKRKGAVARKKSWLHEIINRDCTKEVLVVKTQKKKLCFTS